MECKLVEHNGDLILHHYTPKHQYLEWVFVLIHENQRRSIPINMYKYMIYTSYNTIICSHEYLQSILISKVRYLHLTFAVWCNTMNYVSTLYIADIIMKKNVPTNIIFYIY